MSDPELSTSGNTRNVQPSPPVPYAPGPEVAGWLSWWDVIVIHTSGGKDSQTALRLVLRILAVAGLLDRVAVLHLVLDKQDGGEPRIEWQQVPELAAAQAARHGIGLAGAGGWQAWQARLAGEALTSRWQWAALTHYARRDVDGDLLDDVATRRKRDGSARGWPTMWTRYCTSDWKTAVGRAFTEFLCQQVRAELGLDRPVRVLQVMGFRAQESADRAKRPVFAFNRRVSAMASRHVFEWLPIHELSTAQVWADIQASGVPYHPVYDERIARLSCRHCVLASRRDLAISRRLSPGSFAAFVAVEDALGDPFQHRRPLASIPAEPGREGFAVHWLACPECGVPVLADTRHQQRWCPAHAATGPWDWARHAPTPGCVQQVLFGPDPADGR